MNSQKRDLGFPDYLLPSISPSANSSFHWRLTVFWEGHRLCSMGGRYITILLILQDHLLIPFMSASVFEMPLVLSALEFSSSPLQDFKFFPWSLSPWKVPAPCEPVLLRALKSSSHLPQCFVVFPVAMAGVKTCQGRRAEGRK